MRLPLVPLRRVCGQHRSLSTFVERDIVLLRQKTNPEAVVLTKPLAPGVKISTHKGDISHSDIIGKSPRDLITTTTGSDYRIHKVTLAEYVSLSRRLVTPIYPADANLIVSLFDFHHPGQHDEKIEILEAGTGHGALTLHLSRAIHGANSTKPVPSPESPPVSGNNAETPEQSAEGNVELTGEEDAMVAWKASRKAVIHTIDISPKYSKHAAKVVAGFRHGLYAGNVDFHVGDVSDWVNAEFDRRDDTSREPFLSHAFLDLPATHHHISAVAAALKTDGILIVFNPSITQIMDCIKKIKSQNMPLFMEQTVELVNNGGSGGRAWDVRAVKPRAAKKVQLPVEGSESAQSSDIASEEEQESSVTRDPNQTLTEPDAQDADWTFVCRPKVGERVIGGGFLGVFRKMQEFTPA